jgi:hypothetical protein
MMSREDFRIVPRRWAVVAGALLPFAAAPFPFPLLVFFFAAISSLSRSDDYAA